MKSIILLLILIGLIKISCDTGNIRETLNKPSHPDSLIVNGVKVWSRE